MKIAPITEAVKFLNRVQEKRDSGGNAHQEKREQNPQHPKQESVDASPEQVEAALDAFKVDEQAQQNGLSASMIGKGPGLRVVLKDGTGATIRQFTGEEFLKLREAAGTGTDNRARGKLLDQKF